MTRQHHFHLDHAGHSITVDVRSGHAREIELLVDGKEVGSRRERASDAASLPGELPGDPALPFTVRVEHLRHRSHEPSCTVLLDGRELPMAER
ncbi:hypothetical protein ACEZCY_15930 [Streptacidiphilus sp. N1-12]|uniref:DUF4982 domain-containing protein n=2 Tax=Streptacidiphilus alkalitolerans TaxID=3342712 RepID=A0ABV6WYC6_9ACTN